MSGCFGRAEAIGHVGEILQGAIRYRGALEPFLISLPAPLIRSVATAEPAPCWSIEPEWKTKALRAAREAAERWA